MQTVRAYLLGVLALGGLSKPSAQAGWAVGVNIGGPVYYRPYYPYRPYYYRPYGAVYLAPGPLYVDPLPAYSAVPVAQPVYAAPAAAPAPVVVNSPVPDAGQADVNRLLQMLADPDERVRADSVMQLGRLRAASAVDPLAATLAGDRSPAVREAAARALGLIGSPRALAALQRAAQADGDRDVRHSAQFAMEVIQARN